MKKCLECGKDIVGRSNSAKFCSVDCRQLCRGATDKARIASWQQIRQDKAHEEQKLNTIQCLICKRWYRQVGTHITQRHEMTARQYREKFDLEVKRGLLPPDLRELFGRQAKENGTVNNLKKGKKFWFKKGGANVPKYKRSHITMERLKNQFKGKNRWTK